MNPAPSDLSSARIAQLLTTQWLGRPYLYFAQIGSTNDELRRRAEAGAAEGLLLVADEQTAGRGRLDRRWWAPPGSSLLMSLLLRPDLPPARASQLTMCLGLGAVEGITEVTGLMPKLKWPNDLTLNGRKLGGMLSEVKSTGDRLDYAVLGLGLNVNLSFTSDPGCPPPAEMIGAATSLSAMQGRPIDRGALLAAIIRRCELHYTALLADPSQGAALSAAWAAQLETLGQDVVVTLPTETLHGRAVDVTPEGGLIIEDAVGQRRTVWSGDVTSARRVL
jgi:BirA family biotin operon repressor/biotin-[acetyl-CoA-carboxylase] ligase